MTETTDQSGNAVAKFAQGQNVDEPLAESMSGGTDYYEQDGLGSVTSLTTATASIAQTYTYDSFGNITNSTGNVVNPFRYTGRELDTETSLAYNRGRYYDLGTGRFLSGDPIGFYGGLNVYSYVGNDPVDESDPFGLQKTKQPKVAKPYRCDAVFPQDPTTAVLAQLVYSEGNGTPVGDLAVASVVVNRANYGNPAEFGNGIIGVINKGFAGANDPKFKSVSNQTDVCKLNAKACQEYKNAVLAAAASQTPDGTNTDALFYYDESIGMPSYLSKGIGAGYIISAPIDGESNRITGGSGNAQDYYEYTDFNH